MNFIPYLLPIPLWISFIINLIIFIMAFVIGSALGKNYRPRERTEEWSPIGAVTIGTLGVAVIILSLTYAIGFNKYNENRAQFIDEAYAFETVYLRASYLDDPDRKIIRSLLKEYVYLRYNMFETGNLKEGWAKAEKLHDRLWIYTDDLAKKRPQSVTLGLFIEALNDALNLQEKRINNIMNTRMPLALWIVLYFISILAIVNIGYFFGVTETHHSLIILFLILTFSALISLIIDFNHPRKGFILFDQSALIDVINNTFNEE